MSICILVVNRSNSLFATSLKFFSPRICIAKHFLHSGIFFCLLWGISAEKRKIFQRTAVIDHMLSCFPCYQVNFWAKVIAVLAMIETDMSILKTISLAFCDLRAGRWNSCPSNIKKKSCHWINGRRSAKIITKVHSRPCLTCSTPTYAKGLDQLGLKRSPKKNDIYI